MNTLKSYVTYVVNRIWLIILIYAISILFSSALFSYFENKPFLDGLWWSCVSALTIGYGDIYPSTLYGRIVGTVFGHFWVFCVIPMIVANIVTNLLIDRDAFTDAEQEQIKSKLDAILAEVKGK